MSTFLTPSKRQRASGGWIIMCCRKTMGMPAGIFSRPSASFAPSSPFSAPIRGGRTATRWWRPLMWAWSTNLPLPMAMASATSATTSPLARWTTSCCTRQHTNGGATVSQRVTLPNNGCTRALPPMPKRSTSSRCWASSGRWSICARTSEAFGIASPWWAPAMWVGISATETCTARALGCCTPCAVSSATMRSSSTFCAPSRFATEARWCAPQIFRPWSRKRPSRISRPSSINISTGPSRRPWNTIMTAPGCITDGSTCLPILTCPWT